MHLDGRGLETEHPGHGHGEEHPSGKPQGNQRLRDLPPETATAPVPDPIRWAVAGLERALGLVKDRDFRVRV